jgi:hypothetical protein
MRTIIFLILLICTGNILRGQEVTDTMKIGDATYMHYLKGSGKGYVSARITQDSVLTVYDTSGMKVDYTVQRWMFSISRNGTYQEVKITGNILPVKCREWVKEQPHSGWICIEGVVVLMPDGTERTLVGEKWVKI